MVIMTRVTTEYSGSGDPQAQHGAAVGGPGAPPAAGRTRLTVDQDRTGGDRGRRRRRVGGAVHAAGRRPARRHRHVALHVRARKAELLDVMLDTVYGEVATPEDREGGWRARLERVARANWALDRRHPWLLQVAIEPPVLGPNLVAKYDHELRAVAGIGLTEIEMDSVLTLVGDYVHGAVRGAVEAALAEQRTGMTDDEWWQAYAPLLEKVFDASRFPTAGARRQRGRQRGVRRRRPAPPAPSSSACNGCWTASTRSSGHAPPANPRPHPEVYSSRSSRLRSLPVGCRGQFGAEVDRARALVAGD